MYKIDSSTGEKIVKSRNLPLFKPYFCPFCQELFVEEYNQSKKGNEKICKGFNFQCSECKECFNEDTYIQVKRKVRNYKATSYQEKTSSDIIETTILELHKQGFSQRDIISLTKFSKSEVEKITKLSKKPSEVVSINKFKKEYLGFLKDMTQDKEVKLAIEFGCTVRQIQTLCKIGNRKIENIRNNSNTKILHPNKIEIVGDRVKIFKLSEKI